MAETIHTQPDPGEVQELVKKLRYQAAAYSAHPDNVPLIEEWARCFTRAAELLAQCHLQPVSVSERLQQMEDLAADAVTGLRYIEESHGRLYGVGWDRVYDKANRLKPAHGLLTPSESD